MMSGFLASNKAMRVLFMYDSPNVWLDQLQYISKLSFTLQCQTCRNINGEDEDLLQS